MPRPRCPIRPASRVHGHAQSPTAVRRFGLSGDRRYRRGRRAATAATLVRSRRSRTGQNGLERGPKASMLGRANPRHPRGDSRQKPDFRCHRSVAGDKPGVRLYVDGRRLAAAGRCRAIDHRQARHSPIHDDHRRSGRAIAIIHDRTPRSAVGDCALSRAERGPSTRGRARFARSVSSQDRNTIWRQGTDLSADTAPSPFSHQSLH